MDRLAILMVTQRAGLNVMFTILYCALEAGRSKKKLTRPIYTPDEVAEMLDDEGGLAAVFSPPNDGKDKDGNQIFEPRSMHPIAEALVETWTAAFPQQRRVEEPNPPQASVPGVLDPPGTSS
jgi:hypothetical protein